MLRRCAAALALVCGLAGAASAAVGDYQVIYAFQGGSDGGSPRGSLISVRGTLYGTTYGAPNNLGTVFSLDPATGTEKVLHIFQGGHDGQNPMGALTYVRGVLYGTTVGGGGSGFGTVFSVNPKTGTEKVVYAFAGGSDGAYPEAGLVEDDGLLYGTTDAGGVARPKARFCRGGCGTVFSLDPSTGAQRVLHAFLGGDDGAQPVANLSVVAGTLYGTTEYSGGATHGTVFSLNPVTGAETIMHSFQNVEDGANPMAGVSLFGGLLYGTTPSGGAFGNGTVFSVDPASGAEEVVHSFGRRGRLGGRPYSGVIPFAGRLKGATEGGGAYRYGALFTLDPATGASKVRHYFEPSSGDGYATASVGADGTLYGTTAYGGAHGYGTVFAITP